MDYVFNYFSNEKPTVEKPKVEKPIVDEKPTVEKNKFVYYDNNDYFDLQILQLPVRKHKKKKIRLKKINKTYHLFFTKKS